MNNRAQYNDMIKIISYRIILYNEDATAPHPAVSEASLRPERDRASASESNAAKVPRQRDRPWESATGPTDSGSLQGQGCRKPGFSPGKKHGRVPLRWGGDTP